MCSVFYYSLFWASLFSFRFSVFFFLSFFRPYSFVFKTNCSFTDAIIHDVRINHPAPNRHRRGMINILRHLVACFLRPAVQISKVLSCNEIKIKTCPSVMISRPIVFFLCSATDKVSYIFHYSLVSFLFYVISFYSVKFVVNQHRLIAFNTHATSEIQSVKNTCNLIRRVVETFILNSFNF